MLIEKKCFFQHLKKTKPFMFFVVLLAISTMAPSILSAGNKFEKYDPKKGKATLKPLVLWAQQGSGDFTNWVKDWKDNEFPTSLKFLWKHNLDKVGFVGWEIFYNGNRIKGPESVGKIPKKLTSAFFSIPFHSEVGVEKGIFEVRISAYTAKPGSSNITIKPEFLGRSEPPVKVRTITGGDAEISLPKLNVVFSKIEVLDDSDDLSAGDLGFAFWVEWNGGKTEYKYHAASVNTGKDTTANITFKIDRSSIPGTTAFIHAYGFDDDETEWIPLGPFIILLAETCGRLADPNSPPSDDCPTDAATGYSSIDTGTLGGVEKAKTDFTIYANGPSLRFKVYGHYEVTLD